MTIDRKPSMHRRLTATSLVVISQMLLVALAISWLIHQIVIAANGGVYFVENNPFILWAEIAASFLIALFAIYILTVQIQRLGERRRNDGNKRSGRS